ncbi:hypothetical protein CYMTET_38120 [Cymbomonas tetramitiformis]|uniref:Uncharacterized protein n=1 Tax=Cymbomonas tetramitiformis TaxID=36881 RepID=A0AAE0CCJ5_9CHLO|nr:hypothetical protein CYMTET_38120 [Cymbomonas tetramitiformis]
MAKRRTSDPRERTQPSRQRVPRTPPPSAGRQTSLVESTAADPQMNAMMQQMQQMQQQMMRYNGPAAGYRIFGKKDWPTVEETEACLAVATGIAEGKPLTEGSDFELFKGLDVKAPDIERKPKVKVEAPEEPVGSPDSPTPSGSGGGGEETLSLAVGDVVDIFACPQGDVERIGDRIDTLGKKVSTLVIARGTVAAFGPGKSLNEKPMVLPSDVYELYIDFVVHTLEGGVTTPVERLLSHHMSMVDELVVAEQHRTGTNAKKVANAN